MVIIINRNNNEKRSTHISIIQMKRILIIIFITLPVLGFSQDPREFNHGTCIVRYLDNNDDFKYYSTWSSSYNISWEHDIYKSIVSFDSNGTLITEIPNQVYINSNEAQEPVNSTLNKVNNYILTVWEDGSDVDTPNVRGQLHLPDGTIIKQNWIIAGGTGSQHSANTSYLDNKYLVFYADEALPSTGGAVVKAKIIDGNTGNQIQSIQLTPNDEDHWWPVSVSNSDNTRTLVVWGNDGYSVRGTVLYNNSGNIEQASTQQDYLINTQQYYYQLQWLEHISKFILIARNGAYNDITDESKICLIDTMGNVTNTSLVNGGILREAKMAVKWSECNQSYSIFYPSGTNHLTQIFIDSNETIISTSNQIINHPDLSNIQWVSTGIWSEFIKDTNGNELFGDKYIALFIMNDINSNNIIKIPVKIDIALFCTSLNLIDTNSNELNIYPNPVKDNINIPNEFINSEYEIYAINGKMIKQSTILTPKINLSFLSNGVYIISIKGKNYKLIKMD